MDRIDVRQQGDHVRDNLCAARYHSQPDGLNLGLFTSLCICNIDCHSGGGPHVAEIGVSLSGLSCADLLTSIYIYPFCPFLLLSCRSRDYNPYSFPWASQEGSLAESTRVATSFRLIRAIYSIPLNSAESRRGPRRCINTPSGAVSIFFALLVGCGISHCWALIMSISFRHKGGALMSFLPTSGKRKHNPFCVIHATDNRSFIDPAPSQLPCFQDFVTQNNSISSVLRQTGAHFGKLHSCRSRRRTCFHEHGFINHLDKKQNRAFLNIVIELQ